MKTKLKKILITFMTIVVTLSATQAMPVHAAESVMMYDLDMTCLLGQYALQYQDVRGNGLRWDIFDYDYYMEQNPDVVAAVGTDHEALYNHYATCGYGEGRPARASRNCYIEQSAFDSAAYSAANPDLTGLDADALYNQYITLGIDEGRQGYFTTESATARDKMFDVIDEIITQDMTDEEKVKAVHDWLCENVDYNYDHYINHTVLPYRTSLGGTLIYHLGVCKDYADTFTEFMLALNIPVQGVTGTVHSSSTVNHKWNKVLLNGTWYYLDVTWDDPVGAATGTVARYTYYLTTDATFGGTHTAEY